MRSGSAFSTGPPAGIAKLPAIKRYVERRSWLHPVRSFFRIHAFLLIGLHGLLALAFSQTRTGIPVDGFLLQALCGVTCTHIGLSVVRELLGVYMMHGMLHTHLAVSASLLFRLTLKSTACILIVSSYYAMLRDNPIAQQRIPPSAWLEDVLVKNKTFCYTSILYGACVLLSAIAQIFPALSTWTRSRRGSMKAVVDAFEPLNRLLVGKAIHTSCADKLPYDVFWASLLFFKFTFSYIVQIEPLVAPTLDTWDLDLSGWYPGVELGKLPNLIVIMLRWTPVIIMYMIDLQLWFMIWTAMYGTVIGTQMHIGEVPNFETMSERFLRASENFNRKVLSAEVPLIAVAEAPQPLPAFFSSTNAATASALKSGVALADLRAQLLPGGEMHDTLRNESFRYFAEAWNAVLNDMRENDLLSNRELQLLLFNGWEGFGFSRCTYLPVFLTAGKLNEAITIASFLQAQGEFQPAPKRLELERKLHLDLTSDFEMAEAIVEFSELAKWTLSTVLGPCHAAGLQKIFDGFSSVVQQGQVLDAVSAMGLSKLTAAFTSLAVLLLKLKTEPEPEPAAAEAAAPDAAPSAAHAMQSPQRARYRLASDTNVGSIQEKVRVVVDALKAAIVTPSTTSLIEDLEALKFTQNGFFWDAVYARSQLAQLCVERQSHEKLRGFVALCSTARVDVKPVHWEVQRRLTWFIGSLFMDMPKPPPVAKMHSWSIMTPFYAEDLIYSARELASKNEDGVSVLYFLKTVHPDEWRFFLERVGVEPADEARLWQDRQLALQLRLWASYRGQTLARTAEGMMLCERALRLQASWEGLHEDALEEIIRQKFTYIISAQAYGQHKRSRDLKAADTEFLLQRFPNLRVAYVDRISSLTRAQDSEGGSTFRESIRFYSVLIKGGRSDGEEVVQECFRVQLPGDIMLGEGKPENQNHAMIFSRGEALQTIDMNQCNYLEEAFKFRNLLHEFTVKPGSTILGFREHIFTGSLSSLAAYMALQEGCFVTLTQRVLYKPLQVRLHYGHPDIFDKLFSMTRGGVSKASRGINLSEDIYAGFNHLLRGATIPYIEYVQVGKGRDVGMQQIYKFEAKLASGNAEQCLSRDVYRIGQRLDFTRLLSFYYSGPGFYFNNACTVFAMFVFLYLQLWSHTLQLDLNVPIVDMLNAQWTLQLGLLLTVPIVCFLAVEHGLVHALKTLLRVNFTGSPLYFMFHMGTKAHYFDSTLKYGGAKYRPTGRGFVMQHEDFTELYRFYASSHLYAGFELLWGLLLLMRLGSWPLGLGTYWRTAWSIWAVMVSWLFSPFWFNPLAFERSKLRGDLGRWLLWLQRKDSSLEKSWESWWQDEHSYLATGSWNKKMHLFLPSLRYALTFVGILASISGETLHHGLFHEFKFFSGSVGTLLTMGLLILFIKFILKRNPLQLRVLSTLFIFALCVIIPVTLQRISLDTIVLLSVAMGYLLAALVRISFSFGKTPFLVMQVCKVYDYLCGGFLMLLCLGLSMIPTCRNIQMRALLSKSFDRGVQFNALQRLLIK